MEKDIERQYKFYRLYRMDFEQAIHTLKIMKRYKKKDVRFTLLRAFVISYACPFSGNKDNLNKNHYLEAKFVPKSQSKLHKELLNLRNQLFAHTDLTFFNPKFAKWTTKKQNLFPMSFRGFDYNKLDAKFPKLLKLAKTLLMTIEDEITTIEKTF